MNKILTLIFASLLTVNTTFARPNEENRKTKQTETVAPDSSASANTEQELLDKIAVEAEEMYYQQMNTVEKQSQTDINIPSKSRGKEENVKKSGH